MDVVVQITTWASNLQQAAAGATGEAGAGAAAQMTETVVPVLNAFKSVKSMGVAAVNSDEGIEQDLKIKIQD